MLNWNSDSYRNKHITLHRNLLSEYNLNLYHSTYVKKGKEKRSLQNRLLKCMGLVVLLPLLDLGLGQSLDILGGVDGSLAANAVDEVQAFGSLEQGFLVTSGIAERTDGVLLDQSSGLGVILLLADDLLHGMNLLSRKTQYE